jgi:hypothetical protein
MTAFGDDIEEPCTTTHNDGLDVDRVLVVAAERAVDRGLEVGSLYFSSFHRDFGKLMLDGSSSRLH